MKPDIEIAREATLAPIEQIAQTAGIDSAYIERYGCYKAKIDPRFLNEQPREKGKLVLVTAMTPTAAGEGKTTTLIGLADALRKIGKSAIVTLREPSLGPVFGMKGGAAGGGYAQVAPMEEINLHFTGDFHAIGAANNLLAAVIDNHIYQGNALGIDPRRITWRRCMDMNDRQLRTVVDGLGGTAGGVPREDGFDITAATEVMAVLCMAADIEDLKARLGRIIVGYTYDQKPVRVSDLHMQGAMAALLVDAIKPNLVQTLEHTPAIIHGGPFANIAHGCNSIIATRTAMALAEYTVTEAGFGADLGAEKFLDIKCRAAGLCPDAVVIVATVRALKMHGGVSPKLLTAENCEAVQAGLPNLEQHIDNITRVFGLPAVVAVNRFPDDTDAEIRTVEAACARLGVRAVCSRVCAQGGEGGRELAQEVVRLCQAPNDFAYAYELEQSIARKLEAIVKRIYRGAGVTLTPEAQKEAARLEKLGYGDLPVCVAKTQYSFSGNAKMLGAPENFMLTIRHIKVSAGAGFLVALADNIMTMPGLPKAPAVFGIDVDASGTITGLF